MISIVLVYGRKKPATKKSEAVVELRITANGKRKYISTGVRLLPKEWSNGSVVGREDWKELNDRLQVMKRKCSEIVTRMMDEGTLDLNAIPSQLTVSMMQQMTFLEYARGVAKTKYQSISKGTQSRYEVVLKFLEEWKGIVHFTDVTERNILLMDNVLAKRGLKECSRWNYHKLLKMFILQAMNDGLVKRNPYAKACISKGDSNGLKRFLSPDEFSRFEKCDIPVGKIRRVRDLFVFQTYTMMGYSDLAAFDYKKCKRVKGKVVYKARRVKTGQEFTIVLLDGALRILKQYHNRLPIISNVKYNDYLKSAVTYAKIDKPVTTHWARHTGATMLLNKGKVQLHIIQHMLGHASIRETEKTYAKLMDETIIETMANVKL